MEQLVRRRILVTAVAKEKLFGGAPHHHSGSNFSYRRRDHRIDGAFTPDFSNTAF